VSNLSVAKPAVGEIQAVSLPGGGCVVLEQTAGTEGRHRVNVTITLPDAADLQLRVNGELLLLGDG
jgi:hypothetical protein